MKFKKNYKIKIHFKISSWKIKFYKISKLIVQINKNKFYFKIPIKNNK
jgi:hypothetical protein